MRRTILHPVFVAAVAVFLCAAVAHAQLSPEYADWADGPAGFLLTKKEQKEWKSITTDAEAKKFIDLFWARRNPSPDTSFNAFKAEFDAKVRYAEENFSYQGHSGAATDRAKVLILMGRPEGIQNKTPSQTVTGLGTTSGGTDEVQGASQIWFYDPAKLADGFKVKGSQLYIMFYEEKLNSNNFVIDRSARESFKGLAALTDAADVYLLHPNMKEVPKPVSLAGGRKASAEHLAWLGQDAPFDETVRVLADLGINDGVSRPLWVHIELPPDAPPLEFIAGQVSSDGEVVSTFEIDATSLDGQYGKAYHLSFPLKSGAYTVEVVGAAAGMPQVTEKIEIEVSETGDSGTWMSPLWLGLSASPNELAKPGEPYNFGGWHMVPVSGPDFKHTDEIVFFGFVVRPALNDEGAIDLKARIRVKRDGKSLGQPLLMPLDASRVFGDLYRYGSSIGLSGLPETGSYEFDFKVTEGTSDAFTELSLPVDVTD
ncbi:MAG: GWxTD domain-containing protein [Acidobacteriota bacterium]|nr:GWxTD domain-containing protein [Acidobacteriota bacterium]